MGLFRQSQNQKPSSSSSSFSFFNPTSMSTTNTDSSTNTITSEGRDTSSAQSVRSTHSNSTVKATSPPHPGMSTGTGTVFPYTVGQPSTFHNDHDTDMEDPFVTPSSSHVGHAHHVPGHLRHRIDSQGVPIPPARTTSLGHSSIPSTSASASASISTPSLPSVQVTIATPTKQRIKDEQNDLHQSQQHHQHPHPYQQGGHAYSNPFGSGSLDITDGYTGHGQDIGLNPQIPYQYWSSNDHLTSTSYTSMEEESDSEIQDQARRWKEEEAAKKEHSRKLGRDRQRKKRQKDRAELEAARAQIQAHAQAQTQTQTTFHPAPYDLTFDPTNMSRNPSITSLAPIAVPHPNLSIVPPAIPPPSSSTSSIYSSLPNSASFPSLSLSISPNTPYTNTSQHTSGQSSPSTLFSPMTPAITSAPSSGSGLGNGSHSHPWANTTTGNRASKSAVDLRSSRISTSTHRPPTSSKSKGKIIHPPPHRVPGTSTPSSSSQQQQNSAKRRRSEPEPEPFKSKEVGLGVIMGIPEHANAQEQGQGQGAIEFLSSPPNDQFKNQKERPGIRRTASDSAAVALDFTGHSLSYPLGVANANVTGHMQRSPTPPLLDSLKTEHLALDEEMPMPLSSNHPHHPLLSDPAVSGPAPASGSAQANLLASIALHALVDNPTEQVQRALAELKFTRDSLLGLQSDLAGFFGRYSLEKEMSAVSLNDRQSVSYPAPMSGYTSHATTPWNESIPLSTTSTRPPSPSPMSMPIFTHSEMIAPSSVPAAEATSSSININTRASASKATPKATKTPSRARSLSSASMRARGLKMSSSSTAPKPGLSLYQETLVSPMTTTPYQFPHPPGTPSGSIPMSMVDSDGASASPMMSSVQTPTTGQGSFPHHEILAIGQGTMRLDQGRAHHVQDVDGTGRSRTMTDPGKSYTGHGHVRHGSHWEQGHNQHQQYQNQGQNQHRSSYSHSQTFTSSGLSSPLDMSTSMSMSFRPHAQSQGQDEIPAPPPHLPPSFAYMQVQAPYTPSNSGQRVRSHTSSGLSTPFTPTPLSHRPHPHTGQGMYQPSFTPIAEVGTPTRPSPRPTTASGGEGRMLGYDIRMDGGSPNPHTVVQEQGQGHGEGQMVPEGNWMTFGHGPLSSTGTASGSASGNADPFGGNIGSAQAHGHGHP